MISMVGLTLRLATAADTLDIIDILAECTEGQLSSLSDLLGLPRDSTLYRLANRYWSDASRHRAKLQNQVDPKEVDRVARKLADGQTVTFLQPDGSFAAAVRARFQELTSSSNYCICSRCP